MGYKNRTRNAKKSSKLSRGSGLGGYARYISIYVNKTANVESKVISAGGCWYVAVDSLHLLMTVDSNRSESYYLTRISNAKRNISTGFTCPLCEIPETSKDSLKSSCSVCAYQICHECKMADFLQEGYMKCGKCGFTEGDLIPLSLRPAFVCHYTQALYDRDSTVRFH